VLHPAWGLPAGTLAPRADPQTGRRARLALHGRQQAGEEQEVHAADGRAQQRAACTVCQLRRDGQAAQREAAHQARREGLARQELLRLGARRDALDAGVHLRRAT